MLKINPESLELNETVVFVNRVSKVVKGGRRFGFSAMVVVGNGEGIVGIGYGKAKDVSEAIKKGASKAKKSLIKLKINKIKKLSCSFRFSFSCLFSLSSSHLCL